MNIPKEILLGLLLVIIVFATGIDVYTDLAHGADLSHTLKEAGIMLLGIIGVAWMSRSLVQQQVEIRELRASLDEQPGRQPGQYLLEARRNFGEGVAQQFNEWGLTNSEKEVGWLLLKGLSLKEIAIIRDTLEKTVRQQASAIYRKAGVAGRHSFAAWFLEDLL